MYEFQEFGKKIQPMNRWVGIFTPVWLLKRNEISHGAKLMYGVLLLHIAHKLFCFPGQRTLANKLGVSIRTVSRYIEELKEYKLILVEQKGQGKTSKYYVLSHVWESDYRNK